VERKGVTDVQTQARSALEPCQKHEQELGLVNKQERVQWPSWDMLIKPRVPRNAQRAAWRETLSGVLTKATLQEWVDGRTSEM
jgi:hypothetical protein